MLFLTLYVLIYSLLHLYAWRWMRAIPVCKGPNRIWIAIVVAAGMMAAPVLSRLAERADAFLVAKALGSVAYLWMLALFLFLVVGLPADAFNALARFSRRLNAPMLRPLSARAVVTSAIAAWGGFIVWGSLEAAHPRLTTLRLPLSTFPPDTPPLRILHISDVHLGISTTRRSLDRIFRLVEESQPDFLVCTGDLVDSPSSRWDFLTRRFASWKPPLGQYAVLGNHEFFTGSAKSLWWLERAGFRVLRSETLWLNHGRLRVKIVGVDDPIGRSFGGDCRFDEAILTREPVPTDGRDAPDLVLFLKHQPIPPAIRPRPFLQLSGHTHAGQIFPFHAVVRAFYPFVRGLHVLGQEQWLYVNSGTGTWGPPVRVGARPEVTLIVVEPAISAPGMSEHVATGQSVGIGRSTKR